MIKPYKNKYKERIMCIQNYFNISQDLAKFLYYKRKRHRLQPDVWSYQLQNALLDLDKKTNIEWFKIKFGEEEELLNQHGIQIDSQPLYPKQNAKNNKEWEYVINKNKTKKILKELKLI